jgi:hypothetical protein
MIVPILTFVLSLSVGSYKSEIIGNEILEIVKHVQPQAQALFSKQGFNGFFPNGPPVEVMTQLVNGKNYAVRVASNVNDVYFCMLLYKSLESVIEINDIKPCESILDILPHT